jgi:hypothetical protein
MVSRTRESQDMPSIDLFWNARLSALTPPRRRMQDSQLAAVTLTERNSRYLELTEVGQTECIYASAPTSVRTPERGSDLR